MDQLPELQAIKWSEIGESDVDRYGMLGFEQFQVDSFNLILIQVAMGCMVMVIKFGG
jgi:hypothetical protein